MTLLGATAIEDKLQVRILYVRMYVCMYVYMISLLFEIDVGWCTRLHSHAGQSLYKPGKKLFSHKYIRVGY